ncbi:MAG: thioredoxin domain-containing protein [Gemmatimonadota bacterium]|nr:thioredoxin domain-containing protein [Gemmatimonadota bacterium]
MTNRLAKESSPYLQQHAENPVDWFPWGNEAFARARELDCPILLSVGYSSCHWCHVMEHESFEDEATAGLMNELFVSIKVDREERPDIDQIYIKAVQAMTGSAGWPLTVWLTPDGVPFYGGTYFPSGRRHGMPAFREVLQAVSDAYRDRKDDVLETGGRLVDALARAAEPGTPGEAGSDLLDAAYQGLADRYDETHGGFGSAPKFPQPVTLEIVLRHAARTGDDRARAMLVHTLRAMAEGGMRDQLAGGFHRYSVDDRWLVPHFEKMLYDNALLARLYVDVFLFTGEADLRTVAEEVFDDVLTDLRAPEGGFYTARDADSEGEEGRFYVWTPEELESVLGPDRARVFGKVYGVTPGGNFEGRSILHLARDIGSVAREEGLTEDELGKRLAEDRACLLDARAAREAPFRDEKVITSWNAMTVRALAEAGAALGRRDYVEAAEKATRFIEDRLFHDGRLLRVFKDGEAKVPGFLEDHAALGNAALSLHGATLDPRWLERARWCCEEILSRFEDPETELLFDTPKDGDALVVRPRDATDGATPSGPSLAAELLVRAGHVFDEPRYRDAAERTFSAQAGALERFGAAFGRMLSALDRARAQPVEVAIVGDPSDDETQALIRAAHERFLRSLTVVGRPPEVEVPDVPLLADRGLVDGRPAAYVCRAFACYLPVTEGEEVRREMERVLEG